MKTENWNPEADRFLKSGERELHQFLHETRSETEMPWTSVLEVKSRRWSALQKAAEKIGGISGRVLEVGAGDGWCSAGILRHYDVEECVIVEVDEAAVNSLIPKMLRTFEVEDKNVTIALGSFNNIPHESHFDFVIAMGALHHSENLFLTLRTLWKALKPGGYLLSQEPAMADVTTNDFYDRKSREVKKFAEGIEIANSERSDHFYRKCEYLTALYHSGFEPDMEDIGSPHATETKTSFADRVIEKFGGIPPCRDDLSLPTNIFLTARKPENSSPGLPITAWEEDS